MVSEDASCFLPVAADSLRDTATMADSIVRSVCERVNNQANTQDNLTPDIQADMKALLVVWNRLRSELHDVTESIDYAASLVAEGSIPELMYMLRATGKQPHKE